VGTERDVAPNIAMSDTACPAAIADGAKMTIIASSNAEFNCPRDSV
jgi:hypothetical protein